MVVRIPGRIELHEPAGAERRARLPAECRESRVLRVSPCPSAKEGDGVPDPDRRRAPTNPSRRDGARGRRRRPRERGRPHARRRVGDARGASTSCCAGRAGSCACRATARWLDKLDIEPMVPRRPGRLRHRVHGVDRPPQRGLGHRRRRSRAHDPARARPGVAARRLHPARPRVPARAPATAACSSGAVTPRPRSTSRASPGSPPVAVICEVLHDDGSPARFPYLELFAQEHRIAMISVAQVADHRLGDRRHRGRRRARCCSDARLCACAVRRVPMIGA